MNAGGGVISFGGLHNVVVALLNDPILFIRVFVFIFSWLALSFI